MTDDDQTTVIPNADATAAARGELKDLIADRARDAAQSEGLQAQIYKAISVQRPVVLEYLRSLRRDKPDASAAELLKELDSLYIATVTVASTGVGASAAIPGIGIPLALGLGVADMLFFYETSAIYVLAVAELHGIRVDDAERARPLVLGMLLGPKSQNQISKLVLTAAGAGSVDQARTAATQVVGKAAPKGWGDILTQQIPDSALAPLTIVIGREAMKTGGKLGASSVGKAIPFGVGAVIGGLGSFYFGRDVVKSARVAFPESPTAFPQWLEEFARPEKEMTEPSRAILAMQSAAGTAKGFGENLWGKLDAATEAFRAVDLDGDGIPDEARALTAIKRAGGAVAETATNVGDKVGRNFRAVDRDGDGVPDEPQGMAAAKNFGVALAEGAGTLADKATSLLRSKKRATPAADQHSEVDSTHMPNE